MPGYYIDTINPARSGTSDSLRITFQASDPANRPIFTGAYGATNGNTAPPNQNTGWALANGTGVLSYGSGSPNIVYRKTGISQTISGVWINEPILGSNPLGRWSSLWMTNLFDTGGGNPDHHIHAWGEQSSGSCRHGYFQDPRDKMHDWKGQARWNHSNVPAGNAGQPDGSLDVRLHTQTTPNPSSYAKVVLGRAFKTFDFQSKNYITYKNLIFQHSVGGQIAYSVGFLMDGCLMYQCSNDCLIIGEGSHDAVIKNSSFISAGSMQEHHADIINIGTCNNVKIQNCYLAYGSHGGLTAQGTFNTQLIDGCTFDHACTAYSVQSNTGGSVGYISSNLTLQNCIFHDYFCEDPYIQRTPHPAIECDSLNGGVFRRNLFYRCAIGILLQQGSDSRHSINNIDIRHNTIVDCQLASIKLDGTGSAMTNIQARNNILVGPSGGETFYRQNMVSNGVGPNVHLVAAGGIASTVTFRNNLYWERVPSDGVVPAATKGTAGTFGAILGGSGAANNNSALWGPTSFNGLGSDQDPLFNNPAWVSGDDYTLKSTSPAIGKGLVLTNPSEPGTDLGYAQFSGGGGGTNPAPTLNLTQNVNSGNAPLTVIFNANASDRDVNGNDTTSALQYSWNFGDSGAAGNIVSGPGPSLDQQTFIYNNTGNYTATVTVTDASGLPAQQSKGVTVTSPSAGGEITSGLTATSFGVGGTDQAGQTPDKIVDGIWASGNQGGGGGGAPGVNNWARNGLLAAAQGVIVDIGRSTTLTRVLVSHYPGGGGTRNYNYTLQTSPTNLSGTYTDIGTKTTDTANEFAEINFSPRANVRYVKLVVNSATPTYDYASFWEMRLFESGVANVAPTVSLTSNVSSGPATLAVNFTATASDPPNSDSSAGTSTPSLSYLWDFGDGSATTQGTGAAGFATRSHNYTVAGTYTCKVTVFDNGLPIGPQLSNEATKLITVTGGVTPTNNPPNVNLQTVPNPASIAAGGSVTFTANAHDQVDSSGGGVTPDANLAYEWTFGDGSTSNGTGTAFDVRSNHVYAAAGTYVCSVKVSDNGIPTSPIQSTTKNVTVTVSGGGTNAWGLVDAWDSFGTPPSSPFAPIRTLSGKGPTDGDPSMRWIGLGPIVSGVTYIAWDMGQARVVKRLRFQMGKQINGWGYVITAQYSNDKSNWTNVPGIVGVATAPGVHFNEYLLGSAISCRYIRLVFTSSTNNCASAWYPRFSDS